MPLPERYAPRPMTPTLPGHAARPGPASRTGTRKAPLCSPGMLPRAECGGCPPRSRPHPRPRPSPAFTLERSPGRPLSPGRLSPPLPPPLSAAELPRLVAEVGPGVALRDSLWTEGPRFMASALGAHVPVSAAPPSCVESTTGSVSDEGTPVEKLLDMFSAVKKAKARLEPVLTGMEVVEIFTKRRHLGKLQFVHLKATEGGAYRPYDLGVVPHDQAGPEHYIFSPSSVLHVRDGSSVGFQTLSDWHREALLWNLLQGLPFFRDFLLRRVFVRWRRNVRQDALQRSRTLLQGQLLLAVPQFREGLLQVSRLLEELKKTHWLPQDHSRTYTLQDFHSALLRKKEEAQAVLERFLQYRACILNMVREDSYRAQLELQLQVEQAQVSPDSQPLHLQLSRQRHLRRDLDRADRALQRLGNMAALVNHMTAQSLVTAARREVTGFIRGVATRRQTQQGGLLRMELVFGTDGQLTLDPPTHLIQDALQGALLSVPDSVLQVFDSCRFSTELKDGVTTSTDPQALTPDPRLACLKGVTGPSDPGVREGELGYSGMPRPISPAKLVLPSAAPLSVEGQKVRGQYYPLSRRPAEWQLGVSGGIGEAQREQDTVTQEALLQAQRLCESHSWLADVRLTCSQWSSASLEAMRGWPSQRYQEHIQRARVWAERVRTLPVSFTTSNGLITVHCAHIREEIAPRLASMEEEVHALLEEEVRLRSEGLASELKRAADWLRADPTDLDGYSQHASTVKRYEGRCGDLQRQQQYLWSLREILRLTRRSVSSEEDALAAQVQDQLSHFLPLLRDAGETVRRRAPSMADALDRVVSSRALELRGLVSRATSGPYLDPSQDTAPAVARLQSACGQFCAVAAQLEQLSETSVIIRGKPLDLSFVEEERQKLEARRGLWELLRASTCSIQEWRRLLFGKFVVLRTQEKVSEWLRQAALLEGRVPPCDPVLTHTLQLLGGFGQQLPLLAKLGSPALKHKHWRNIFRGMELLYTPEGDLTVADLLSKNPLDHQNMINKVCQDAEAEANAEQAFRKLQQRWEETLFRLASFLLTAQEDEEQHPEPASGRKTPDGRTPMHRPRAPQSRDSGTFIIIGLEALLAQTEDSVATLSSMLLSPHAVEFRLEVEHWVQKLQQLGVVLDAWRIYQLKWAFLSKMFHESGVMTQKPELYQRFLPVDVTYREMIRTMSSEPRVLSFVQLGHGQRGLRALLAEGRAAMEGISARLLHLLEASRDRFPRLRFLGDGEVMELLSLHAAPAVLLPLVRKCFRGVRGLEMTRGLDESPELEETGLSSTQSWVGGVFGGLGERVPFLCPLGPSLDSLAWLCQLEQRLLCAMVQLMAECAVARERCRGQDLDLDLDRAQGQDGDGKIGDAPSPDPQRPSTPLSSTGQDGAKDSREVEESPSLCDLASGFPLQCLLVVEEALWCREVRQAFRSPARTNRVLLKAHYGAKLRGLCQLVRDRSQRSPGSRREMEALRAMVMLTIKHSRQLSGLTELQCDLEVSFEWQRLMKYRLSAGDRRGSGGPNPGPADSNATEPSCYVDVLSSRLPYGYEYLGPEHWMMVNTPSSDRAALGILLALTCYRCSFVRGPPMSGKTETAANLGRALGRQVIILHCCRETSPAVVLQMLIGALQTGAWLLLDNVDSITQGALSLLGQHLSDIHQQLSLLLGCSQRQRDEPQTKRDWTCPPSGEGGVKSGRPQISLAGKTIWARPGYGCVLISSGGYASDVPENLRVATRRVSLVRPDYKVIAEVTLAALGFSEAASTSCRLVSLFDLAERSACLPEATCAGATSWAVLLNKVLTAAGWHLSHSLRVEWDKDKVTTGDEEAQRQLHDMVLRAPEGSDRETKGPHSAHSKRTNQCAVVLRVIAEEQAIVKAVTSAVASAIVDPGKAQNFRAIFGEIFPSARCPLCPLRGREEEERASLKAAVAEALQEAGLHPSPCLLSSALSLYQALRLSRAVVLVGPAGSGKTACYRALAGGLRKLAAREVEEGPGGLLCETGEGTGAGALTWSSVDTAVIFPNALSSEELWGSRRGEQGSWWDGALTKVLRDSQELSAAESSTTDSSASDRTRRKGTRARRTRREKWLVLDGEPTGRPGWLDLLRTLCDPADPFLCLPTGEKLRPSPGGELKIVIEAADLRDATPSTVTRCGLVLRSAEEWWKAVWMTELGVLHKELSLDPRTLSMWSRLAEDLFARTLAFLRQRALAPVLPEGGAGAIEVTHGVQEVMSFVRILRALSKQFGSDRLRAPPPEHKREGTVEAPQKVSQDASNPSAQRELEARNAFALAYIWGFGGHLHPRHWPQFDQFARDALLKSRYRVEVPAEGSVFAYVSDAVGSLQMSHTTIPQYERHAFLLCLMLKARQPVLLVGESGSGKTTLCHSVLGPKVPHLRLPASSRLRATDLRDLLEGVAWRPAGLDATATVAKQPGLLLFVDDLHDAPCDVFGKASTVLETLRQCVSEGSVLASGGCKLLPSGALGFLATCDTPGEGRSSCPAVSPRLSRLFTVLALPGVSPDLIFSIHAPRLRLWLNELPSATRPADMADRIIGATLRLYHAVREAFPPRPDRPHFLFSPHDLRKVFQGMCLWASPGGEGVDRSRSSSVAVVLLGVARLWTHECLRTFGDRLCSEEEGGALLALLARASERNFGSGLTSAEPQGTETGRPEENKRRFSSRDQGGGEGEEEGASARGWSTASSAEVEDEDRAEGSELWEISESGSGSDCSGWDGTSEENPLSETLSEEPDRESASQGQAEDIDNDTLHEALPNPDPLSESTGAPSASRLSPPRNGGALGKPDGKRSEELPQCTSVDPAAQAEHRPASADAVLHLLRDLGAALRDRVFIPDLSTPLKLLAQRNYREQDLEGLVLHLSAMLMRKEEEDEEEGDEDKLYGGTAGYVVHRQGALQLAHVLRTLLLPGGHGCLLGTAKGTGRKTTVRLAARLMGYRLLEVHSGNEASWWEMLEEAGARAGGGGLVLLVHDGTSQAVREELLVAMANGGLPRLRPHREWKSVTQRISKLVKGFREGVEDGRGTEGYFRKIQGNTHVFLLLPLGGSLARALSLCSCVEVYQPWTTESLIQVATHRLKDLLLTPNLDTKVDRAGLAGSISQAMAGIHQSSRRYASVLTPDLRSFGPQTYAEFTAHYLYLCTHLCDHGRSQANRAATVLGRMKELSEKADQCRQEVLSLRSEFTEAQQRQVELQCAVDDRRSVCERARQHCLLEETRLSHLEDQLQEARQQSQDALQQVSPLYEAALAAMRSLSQSDLEELRRYRRPPEGVMGVMGVICMLFHRPSSWESCQQLLGQTNFLQELEFFDRSAVRGELLRALGVAVSGPGFQPEAVRGVSRACESLCRWALAMYRCAVELREAAPREARREELERRVGESRARLRDARLQEDHARAWLEDAEARLQGVRRAAEEVAARLREAETREKDAAGAVQQVAPLVADWTAAAQGALVNAGTAPGDALLLAAAAAYLGPFGPDVRSELLGKWRRLCLTGEIDVEPEDPRTTLLLSPSPPSPPLTSTHIPIPLGEDIRGPMARLMGVTQAGVQGVAQAGVQGVAPRLLLNLLLWGYGSPRAQRCPLLADADQREGIRIPSSAGQLPEREGECDQISADDPALLEKLREGAERGLRVLVTHVERARPSPGFLELLGRRAPPAGRPGLVLFLSTSVPVGSLLREIHPSILAEVQVVDLSLSTEELREVMLTELGRTRWPKLWSQNSQVKTDRRMLLDRVHQQEVSLMEYVLQSSTPLHQDPQFLPRLSACRSSVSGLRAELRELNRELERQRPLLARAHAGAELAAAFFEGLRDVERLCPLYLFPLRRHLLALREAADTTDGGEAEAVPVSAEVLASRLLEHYRPRLSQDHAAVLRLLVSVAMARLTDGGSQAERTAFLRGLSDEDFLGPARTPPRSPLTSLPSWIPTRARGQVLRLDGLPSFRGLASSLTSDPAPWREYLRFPSSTVVGPVPVPCHAHLTSLQRALLWKTLLPHWLAAVASDLAACQLGKPLRASACSSPPGTPEALSQILDKTRAPVILILPGPGDAGPPPVPPLDWVKQAAQCSAGNQGVKVEVISFGAECQRETVLPVLNLAVQEGHWLVFNNCHLLDQWDEEVVCQVTKLVSCTERASGHVTRADKENDLAGPQVGGAGGAHPRFRMWFITRAHEPLSVPAAVRSCALRLVCDSPWDLGEALRCSLRQAVSVAAPGGLLGRCAALHSVLLQRQACGRLGQGSPCYWSQEDLQVLLEAQVWTDSRCDDPVGAMEYIAGSLVYGGHVEDPVDLEAVRGVVTACFRPPPPVWGRGPHSLSELVAAGRFGQRDAFQDVERCVQASCPSGDPLLLGLGAGLAEELVRSQSRTLHLLLRLSQTPGARPRPGAAPPLTQAQDRLQALRNRLERDGGFRPAPQTPHTPLRLFLWQEWDGLVRSVVSLLEDLDRTHVNSIPALSPPPTPHALSRLEHQAELLGAYLWKESPETPPYAYRLSAFRRPRGFLAALLREEAKAQLEDVTRLSLHFQVLSAGEVPSSSPPDGAYLHGLELQGALWDARLGALRDNPSARPCPLPLVWVRAKTRPPESPAPLPLYRCPLYPDEGPGEGLRGQDVVIAHVPLVAELDPALCALRRVRLVSTLQDGPSAPQ